MLQPGSVAPNSMDKATILSRLYLVDAEESFDSLRNRWCDELEVEVEFFERQMRVDEKRKILRDKISHLPDELSEDESSNNLASDSGILEKDDETIKNSVRTEVPFNSSDRADCFSIVQGGSSNPLTLQSLDTPDFVSTRYTDNNTAVTKDAMGNSWSNYSCDYVPMYRDEIFWDINFRQSAKVYHSKLFLFAGIYWNVVFGLNDSSGPNSGFYYMHLSPAQELSSEARLMCEFRVFHNSSIVYSRRSSHDLVFPPLSSTSSDRSGSDNNISVKGLDRFIGDEIYQFVDPRVEKLHLSVVVSTDIGPRGELIGCSTPLQS